MTLSLGICNTTLLAWTFRKGLFRPNVRGAKDTAAAELKATLASRTVWILNGFFSLYVGAEVTAGGTCITLSRTPIDVDIRLALPISRFCEKRPAQQSGLSLLCLLDRLYDRPSCSRGYHTQAGREADGLRLRGAGSGHAAHVLVHSEHHRECGYRLLPRYDSPPGRPKDFTSSARLTSQDSSSAHYTQLDCSSSQRSFQDSFKSTH